MGSESENKFVKLLTIKVSENYNRSNGIFLCQNYWESFNN